MSRVLVNLSPSEILARLKDAGITMAGIARDLGVSAHTVREVIYDQRSSYRVRVHVAACLGLSHVEVWPENYAKDPGPPRRGRPRTRGLFPYAPRQHCK